MLRTVRAEERARDIDSLSELRDFPLIDQVFVRLERPDDHVERLLQGDDAPARRDVIAFPACVRSAAIGFITPALDGSHSIPSPFP
jgi:hypothetical protein